MKLRFQFRAQQSVFGLGALTLIAAFGCREAEQIRSYSVPKEAVQVAETLPANPGEPSDRMLAAIMPAGEQAWFFKVVGPLAAVDAHEQEINGFFSSIQPVAEAQPKWTLPTGWKEEAGNAMRAATLLIPAEGKPLELSVTRLP